MIAAALTGATTRADLLTGESGTLQFNKAGSDPLFTIAAAPVPELDPGGLGAALALVAGVIGLFERRRSPDPD